MVVFGFFELHYYYFDICLFLFFYQTNFVHCVQLERTLNQILMQVVVWLPAELKKDNLMKRRHFRWKYHLPTPSSKWKDFSLYFFQGKFLISAAFFNTKQILDLLW